MTTQQLITELRKFRSDSIVVVSERFDPEVTSEVTRVVLLPEGRLSDYLIKQELIRADVPIIYLGVTE